MISGFSRIRNEALILEDTFKHFFKYCDDIYIYDDCSTDNSVEIMKSFDNVNVIEGKQWKPDQIIQESIHRRTLLEKVRDSDMCLCFDTDERLVGDLPTVKGGYTFDLYDGYMTKDRKKEYTHGKLSELPRMWGIECRELLMFFDPKKAKYDRNGQRVPTYSEPTQKSNVKVKHYGKCLSVQHWEDKCEFYEKYFFRHAKKWKERKGKAIHDKSDFNTKLLTWNELCLKY